MIYIRLPNRDLQKVQEYLDAGKKIQAIKLVRNNGRKMCGSGVGTGSIGLKEAKHAVDSLQSGLENSTSKIVPAWSINSFIVTGPLGEKIEMDIDMLQMNFLTTLSSVGLEEVAHLCDLVDYVKQWQQGLSLAPVLKEDA